MAAEPSCWMVIVSSKSAIRQERARRGVETAKIHSTRSQILMSVRLQKQQGAHLSDSSPVFVAGRARLSVVPIKFAARSPRPSVGSREDCSWLTAPDLIDWHRSELHRDRLTVRLGCFEELPQLETEHPGKNIGREGLNLGIQIAYYCVVIRPRVLDWVFSLAQGTLQLGEFL